MDFGTLIEKIAEHGGPAMLVALMFLYYLHRQTEKKDEEVAKVREENRKLYIDRIDTIKTIMENDAENRKLIERLVDKTGATTEAMREYFRRMEEAHAKLILEIQSLRNYEK